MAALIAIELNVINGLLYVESDGKGHADIRIMDCITAMLYGGVEIEDQTSFGTHSDNKGNSMKSSS
jgi:hypothetical protein